MKEFNEFKKQKNYMKKGIEYIQLQMSNLKKDGSDIAIVYYWSLNEILKQVKNCSIPAVVGQSEQLVCPDCKHNVRMQNGFIWCENDDCGGIYRAN